ncbi:PRD domain-containing protein [Floccifex sp.]|uniref:PRD domain-containing protein n=1 Tax=Floccifex sp. TaxID=2815810 RepID=UPI002A7493AD|nr:PRD domain-containing protein [Floccifex sp.]MDD7280703.1 PRD domain-containing protein [Erysipelotrichaceae bacterium]MDY2959133.1 PRD domain-containing protein [Floccifex sp.]
MKAIRVFNNNAVSTVIPNKGEAIVIGPGVGFNRKAGDRIDRNKIEKVYYIQNDLQTKFMQLLKDTRPEALKAAEVILEYAREQGLVLKDQLIISLTDHISFALERLENNIELPYLMMSETKMLYPKECEIAYWGVKQINEICHCTLPDYESGYIALQLVSSSMDKSATINTLTLVKEALALVKDVYGVSLNDEDFNTMRLTTHLKFLAQRIFSDTKIGNEKLDEGMDNLHHILLETNPKNEVYIMRLKTFILDKFKYELSEEEEVYLLVHLTKIFK